MNVGVFGILPVCLYLISWYVYNSAIILKADFALSIYRIESRIHPKSAVYTVDASYYNNSHEITLNIHV